MSATKIEAKKREHFDAARTQIHRAASLTEKIFDGGCEFRRVDTIELNRLTRDAYAATQSLDGLAAGEPVPEVGDRP